jgi:ABC-type antimicrobial peptide transport system permease subunit
VWAQFYLAFALAALFLAGLGVYGVMAFVVAQRAPEIGIRRALGASGASVQRSVLGGSLSRVALAIPLGALLGWWLGRGLDRVLYEVDAGAPGVYAAVIAVVLMLALVGAWVPAVRAGRVDPMRALRLD